VSVILITFCRSMWASSAPYPRLYPRLYSPQILQPRAEPTGLGIRLDKTTEIPTSMSETSRRCKTSCSESRKNRETTPPFSPKGACSYRSAAREFYWAKPSENQTKSANFAGEIPRKLAKKKNFLTFCPPTAHAACLQISAEKLTKSSEN
jgi:hypothetical protein